MFRRTSLLLFTILAFWFKAEAQQMDWVFVDSTSESSIISMNHDRLGNTYVCSGHSGPEFGGVISSFASIDKNGHVKWKKQFLSSIYGYYPEVLITIDTSNHVYLSYREWYDTHPHH